MRDPDAIAKTEGRAALAAHAMSSPVMAEADSIAWNPAEHAVKTVL